MTRKDYRRIILSLRESQREALSKVTSVKAQTVITNTFTLTIGRLCKDLRESDPEFHSGKFLHDFYAEELPYEKR